MEKVPGATLLIVQLSPPLQPQHRIFVGVNIVVHAMVAAQFIILLVVLIKEEPVSILHAWIYTLVE
jgi:hypothetical protein